MKIFRVIILAVSLTLSAHAALADVAAVETKVFKFAYNKDNIYEQPLPSKICDPVYYLTRKYLGKELTSKRKKKFSKLTGIKQVKAWHIDKYKDADMKAKDGHIYLIVENEDLVRAVCFEELPDNSKKSKKDKKSKSKSKSKKDKKSSSKSKSKKDKKSKSKSKSKKDKKSSSKSKSSSSKSKKKKK